MAVHCSLGCTEYTYIGMLGAGGVLCWWQEMYCCLPSRTILPNGAYMFFMLPRCVYFLSGRIMHWPLEQQVLRGHGRVCTMEFDTKVGSENNIKRKHKTRKLSSPRPFRVPKDFLQRSQKQPEILPEFSGFYSLRACFCLAIIPTTESCEKARADRVVSALPALSVESWCYPHKAQKSRKWKGELKNWRIKGPNKSRNCPFVKIQTLKFCLPL